MTVLWKYVVLIVMEIGSWRYEILILQLGYLGSAAVQITVLGFLPTSNSH